MIFLYNYIKVWSQMIFSHDLSEMIHILVLKRKIEHYVHNTHKARMHIRRQDASVVPVFECSSLHLRVGVRVILLCDKITSWGDC